MISNLSLALTGEQARRLADDKRRELAAHWGRRRGRRSGGTEGAGGAGGAEGAGGAGGAAERPAVRSRPGVRHVPAGC